MNGHRNPVYARLTRRSRWPSSRATLWLAFGLGLAALAVTAWETLHLEGTALGSLTTTLLLVAWVLYIVTPGITALVAAVMVSREARDGTYDLLNVTTLPARSVAWGYVRAALHRQRLLLAACVALMPAQVVGLLQFGIVVSALFIPIVPLDTAQYGPVRWDVIEDSLIVLGMVVGLWGMNLVAAALGVGLATRLRRSAAASFAAPLVSLLLTLILIVLEITFVGSLGLGLAALYLLAPYLLAAGAIALARRWAGTSRD